MAAYDFPPTAGEPTDGSFTYTAPTGEIYSWNGYSWVIAGGNTSNTFVRKSGDQMTGQLSLAGGGGSTEALQKQEIQQLISTGVGIPEAPIDGQQYARQNANWSVVTGGGGGGGGTTKADIYGTAKAWGSINGSNGSKLSGLNFTSSKVTTGRYQVTLDPPMSSDEYTITLGDSISTGTDTVFRYISKTVTGFEIQLIQNANYIDAVEVDFAVFDNQPAEIIVGSGSVTNTNIYGTAKAWGDVATDGTLTNGSDCTVTRTQAGYYQVTFLTPRTDSDYSVVTAPIGPSAGVSISPQIYTNTGFTIRCLSEGGSSFADSNFNFAVFDNKPAEVALTTFGDVINYSGAAAWGTFNGVDKIQGSLNIASITKDNTGRYSVVFTTPMPNAEYAVTGSVWNTVSNTAYTFCVMTKTPSGFSYSTIEDTLSSVTYSDQAASFVVHALNALPPHGGTGTDSWATVDQTTVNGPCNVPASFNVAEVERGNTGNYIVKFTTPMPTADYAVQITGEAFNGVASGAVSTGKQTDQFTVVLYNSGTGAAIDVPFNFTVNATNAVLPDSFSEEEIQSVVDLAQSGATNPGLSAWGFVNNGILMNGLNVSSVISNPQIGVYDISFTTPMPDNSYSVVATSGLEVVGNASNCSVGSKTPNGFQIAINKVQDGTSLNQSFQFQVAATNALPPRGGTGTDAWAFVNSSGVSNATFNCSTVRQSTGTYLIKFDTPMPTSNYSVVASPMNTSNLAFTYIDLASGKGNEEFYVYTTQWSDNTLANAPFSVQVNCTNATLPATVTQEQIESAINNPGLSAWGTIYAVGTLVDGLNATSVKTAAGQHTVSFITPMPDDTYSVTATVNSAGSAFVRVLNKTANGFDIKLLNTDSSNFVDSDVCFQVAATNALPPKGGTGTDSWGTIQSDGTLDASFNVGSATRLSEGYYQVVFTTPMPTSDYGVVTSPEIPTPVDNASVYTTITVTQKTSAGFYVLARFQDRTDGSAENIDSGFNFAVNATNATLPSTFTEAQIQSVVDLAQAGLTANSFPRLYGCIQGVGSVSLLNSYNTSSVTYVSTGTYRVAFPALPSADYVVVFGSGPGSGSGNKGPYVASQTTTSFIIYTYDGNGQLQDANPINYVVYQNQ